MNKKDYIYNPRHFRGSKQRHLMNSTFLKGNGFIWLLVGFILGCITMVIVFEKAPSVIQQIIKH